MRPYKLIKNINRGGFGRVDLVEGSDGKQYAMKVYDPSPTLIALCDPTKLLARFVREVQVQQQLDPDYVVPILDAELNGPSPWFVMPLADESYREQINRDRLAGKIDPTPLADILNAVDILHRLGFVHRDLKPENILRFDKRWKISDFGLVTPPPEPNAPSFTSTNSSYGTEAYEAPEQRLRFKKVKAPADIYSLGCILHDLADVKPYNRIPFVQQTVAGPLKSVVEKCTTISAYKRYQDVKDLRVDLLTVLASPTAAGGPPPSKEAAKWAADLQSSAAWDAVKFEDFLEFLDGADRSDRNTIFSIHVDDGVLAALHVLDRDLFDTLVDFYAVWLREGSFDFAFCDVIILRAKVAFALADTGGRAQLMISAAAMARGHNRWFVMRQVMSCCDSSLDDATADRLAIELKADNNARYDFERCADRISRTVAGYHPKIAAAFSAVGASSAP